MTPAPDGKGMVQAELDAGADLQLARYRVAVALYQAGNTKTEIATALRLSHKTVRWYLRSEPRRPTRYGQHGDEIAALLAAGGTPRQVHEETGVPLSTVYYHQRQRALRPATDARTDAVLALHRDGLDVAATAESLGIRQQTASDILGPTGHAWKRPCMACAEPPPGGPRA